MLPLVNIECRKNCKIIQTISQFNELYGVQCEEDDENVYFLILEFLSH